MFAVKIDVAVKQAGLGLEYARSQEAALAMAQEKPALMIVDLNHRNIDAIALIAALKAGQESKGVPLLAFVAHVDVERKRQAQEAGCETVIARSAFSVNLPQILKRHTGTL